MCRFGLLEVSMTPEALDRVFPYVCFAYGVMMTVALNVPALVRIADERFPADMIARWHGHRTLGYVCLFVGAAWILQNLWFA